MQTRVFQNNMGKQLNLNMVHCALFRSDLFGNKVQVNTNKKKEWVGVIRHVGPTEVSVVS